MHQLERMDVVLWCWYGRMAVEHPVTLFYENNQRGIIVGTCPWKALLQYCVGDCETAAKVWWRWRRTVVCVFVCVCACMCVAQCCIPWQGSRLMLSSEPSWNIVSAIMKKKCLSQIFNCFCLYYLHYIRSHFIALHAFVFFLCVNLWFSAWVTDVFL